VTTAIVHGALWANDLARLGEPAEPAGYAIAEVCGGGAPAAHLAIATDLGDEVHERLSRGVRAWACWHRPEADLVAWLWVSTGREWAWPLRRDLRFATDECHGWGAATLPEHRGRGLCSALLRWAGARMAAEGYRWMWNGILDENLPSHRAHWAAGFRPILRLTAIHEPAPSRLWLSGADYADPELVERARRTLRPIAGVLHVAAAGGG
jgi:ribosomal protein S18 acetylase RimI-like enzyme